jgi:hypothetical protein
MEQMMMLLGAKGGPMKAAGAQQHMVLSGAG